MIIILMGRLFHKKNQNTQNKIFIDLFILWEYSYHIRKFIKYE
jgi:hypothetical protein